MTINDNDPLSEGLMYEDQLPLGWMPLQEPVSDSQLIRTAEQNEHLLQGMITLQEHHSDTTEEDSENTNEIKRIELKLDLLLEIVSQLKKPCEEDPDTKPLRLGAKGIAWKSTGSPLPEAGQHLWVTLRLDPRLPRPLKLQGEVVAVDKGGEADRVLVKFQDLGQKVTELLEKIIFRHHRRQVAFLKAGRRL